MANDQILSKDRTLDFLLNNLNGSVSDLVRCLKKIDPKGTTWQDVYDTGEKHPLYKCLKCNNPYNIGDVCYDFRSKYYFFNKGLDMKDE